MRPKARDSTATLAAALVALRPWLSLLLAHGVAHAAHAVLVERDGHMHALHLFRVRAVEALRMARVPVVEASAPTTDH